MTSSKKKTKSHFVSDSILNVSYSNSKKFLSPQVKHPQIILDCEEYNKRVRANEVIINTIEPIFGNLTNTFPDGDFLLLCDATGVVLKYLARDGGIKKNGKTILGPGAVLSEESLGTNAVSLAMNEESMVILKSEQHFCYFLRDWRSPGYSAAAPIKDQQKNVIAYLGIFAHGKDPGLTMSFLEATISLVETKINQNQIYEETTIEPKILELLSVRELEVLKLKLLGYSSNEIAKELKISPETVKSHNKNIYQKLNVNSKKDCIRKAKKLGLITVLCLGIIVSSPLVLSYGIWVYCRFLCW